MAQLVYGKNVVKQMLKDAGEITRIYLSEEDAEIIALAKKAHIPVEITDRRRLTKMTGTKSHNGAVASIKRWTTYDLDEIIASHEKDRKGLIIMADGLEDPRNLGAILRSADAVKADGVILKKDRAVGLTPAAAKASAGAVDTVKCVIVTNLAQTCDALKSRGWWIIGADMDGIDYRQPDYDMNTVLVIGNEGKGLSRLVKEKCDMIVSIPMAGKITSLNASVSAAVLMYRIYDKRFPL